MIQDIRVLLLLKQERSQMLKNNFTVTIGIPAYNEEMNIEKLLRQLSAQELNNGLVKSITIAIDGCTDNTKALVRKFKNHRIVIINGLTQKGKAYRLNQIIRNTTSDFLVLLDADTSIEDTRFIEKLIRPLLNRKADFTSPALCELPVRCCFEKILEVSMQLKRILFKQLNHGHNIYNCHGPARAFNRKAYQLLNFPKSEGEDMYSYLRCIKAGLKFKYVEKAIIKYHLPANLKDHLKQTTRFNIAGNEYQRSLEFPLAKDEYYIPLLDYILATIKAIPFIFINFPYVFSYILIFIYSKYRKNDSVSPDMWNVTSSKSVKL
jgi:glycosyltransferase involved in cell wall biosynthesis